MQKIDMPPRKFNRLLNSAWHDNELMKEFYEYASQTIKNCIKYNYNNNSFFNEVPHDIILKITLYNRPDYFITNPVAYLCRLTHNHIRDLLRQNNNRTLELNENCPYEYDFESNIEFNSEDAHKAWNKLDYLSRKILYMNECLKYKEKEVAEMLDLHYDNVRTIKSRAIKQFKKEVQK